ncbi:unnamed protein product [Caenorhabditis sp. 36 PRJEB53466]|nr:unnamed protein product [Caenorhabditis sp. 36 PRJEB53466]
MALKMWKITTTVLFFSLVFQDVNSSLVDALEYANAGRSSVLKDFTGIKLSSTPTEDVLSWLKEAFGSLPWNVQYNLNEISVYFKAFISSLKTNESSTTTAPTSPVTSPSTSQTTKSSSSTTPFPTSAKKASKTNKETTFQSIPDDRYYAVVYNDTEDDFKLIELKARAPDRDAVIPWDYPTKDKIESQDLADYDEFKVSETDIGTTGAAAKLTGKLYFPEKECESTAVFQSKSAPYNVDVSDDYIVIFSKTAAGSTLGKFSTSSDTSFTVYSGLPGEDGHSLYVYDSKLNVDEMYIPEDHFYVSRNGDLNFEVTDGGESPNEKTFTSNGFVMSTHYPQDPDVKSLSVKLKPNTADRPITFQVTAAPEETTGAEKEMIAEESDSEGVTVSVGDQFKILIKRGSSAQTGTILPANTDHFQISAKIGYVVQFDIGDPVNPATNAPTTPTAPTTAPTVTTAHPTCPQCNCFSTSTEPSTTTQSASVSSVASVFTMIFAYNLF